jgi:hypothetical protein
MLLTTNESKAHPLVLESFQTTSESDNETDLALTTMSSVAEQSVRSLSLDYWTRTRPLLRNLSLQTRYSTKSVGR